MISFPLQQDEEKRLCSLDSFKVFEAAPDASFDQILSLAAHATESSIGCLTFQGKEKLWAKAVVGGAPVIVSISDSLTCPELLQEACLAVEDIRKDKRFRGRAKGFRYAAFLAALVRDEHGMPLGVLAVFEERARKYSAEQIDFFNSSARQVELRLKTAREELRDRNVVEGLAKSSKLLESYFVSSPMLMGIVGLENNEIRHLRDNTTAAKFFDVSREEMSFRTPVELEVPESVTAIWLENYNFSFEAKAPAKFTYCHRFPNREVWLDVTVNFIDFDERGRKIFSYIAEDVSEQVRTRRELENDRSQMDLITSHLGSVIWMTDPEKRHMVFVSKAYEKIWGRSMESLLNSPWSLIEAIHPEDRERIIAALPKQLEGTYDETYRILTPEGQERWVHDRAYPVRDMSGVVYRVVGIASDVTEMRASQKIIEEQRLRIALSAKLSSLGEMAGGIAHEINNPLTIILGKASLLKGYLKESPLDLSKLERAAESIFSTAERVGRIVKGLKIFSRRTDSDPFVEGDLNQIIADALEFCQERYHRDGIRLVQNTVPDCKLTCRPIQITQVVMNLIKNACDAIRNTERPWVEVTTRVVNEYCEIDVRDSGVGIPQEIVERIMEPFFTTKPVGEGTGLGLSISAGIIANHQGTLKYSLKDGHTCFTIRVPQRGISQSAA